ncbi:hypothetical protein RJ639_005002 [Escallonia herrerae]|uniref:THIF-type NAD/FAD binding fold domain-containing protein n=1 Tax=Escallonia herrerae TaxID=1293975 RepID=A0AA88WAA5_9ASTE|nr:hypothetical protein RJ639_005002 [Escallonia herrerae]
MDSIGTESSRNRVVEVLHDRNRPSHIGTRTSAPPNSPERRRQLERLVLFGTERELGLRTRIASRYDLPANLLKSSILVVGAGGLGSPALLYLAASGVGRLGLVDHDVVELNNLHRQIIHTEDYIGRSKVESVAAACRSINSTLQIVEHKETVRTSNALEIMSKYDVVIVATDNVPSRYMISDCCVLLGKV